MSLVDYTVFTEEQSEELMNILSENDFLDEKLDVETIKTQIVSLLGIEEKIEWWQWDLIKCLDLLYHKIINQTVKINFIWIKKINRYFKI